MKRMKRTVLIMIFLLTAWLVLSAAAEGAFPVSKDGALAYQRRYEVLGADTAVYREGAFSTLWGTLPAGTVLPVLRLSTGFVTVTVNGQTETAGYNGEEQEFTGNIPWRSSVSSPIG